MTFRPSQEKHIVNNAYEAICKLPGVQDRNGKLSLVGAKDVTVILNGKASTLTQEQLIEYAEEYFRFAGTDSRSDV